MNLDSSAYRMHRAAPRAIRERFAGMPESHIADIWLREAVPGRAFVTDGGETIILRSAGRPNRGDGPDFEQAILLRDGAALTGAIEIHRTERDWDRHGHDRNPRYARVILHVVLSGKSPRVKSPAAERLTVYLADNLPFSLSRAWEKTRANASSRDQHPMPEEACSAAPERARRAMIALAAAGRFRRKRERMEQRRRELVSAHFPGEGETLERRLLYEFVSEALGYSANREPMRRVAEAMPPAYWETAGSLSFFERGVILLGASNQLGALASRVSARSALRLQSVWESLRLRVPEIPAPFPAWNQGCTRPGNAPHNRLLALAALIPKFLDPEFLPALRDGCRIALTDPSAGMQHCERMLAPRERLFLPDYGAPAVGRERLHEIAVNILAPFFHLAGSLAGDEELAAAAARIYFSSPSAPRNRIVDEAARRLSLPAPDASGAQQGMLELHGEYCEKMRCAECLASGGI